MSQRQREAPALGLFSTQQQQKQKQKQQQKKRQQEQQQQQQRRRRRQRKARVTTAAAASGERRKLSARKDAAAAAASAATATASPTKAVPPPLPLGSPGPINPHGSVPLRPDSVAYNTPAQGGRNIALGNARPQTNVGRRSLLLSAQDMTNPTIAPQRPNHGRRRRRGLDIVTNRIREYDNSGSSSSSQSMRAPVIKGNGRNGRQPTRPNQRRTDQQGLNRHENLIKHSKAVFLQHGVGVIGDSSSRQDYLQGTQGADDRNDGRDEGGSSQQECNNDSGAGKVMVARARSIAASVPDDALQTDEKSDAEKELQKAKRRARLEQERQAKAEKKERQEADRGIQKAKEAEALAKYTAGVAEMRAKEEAERVRLVTEEHLKMQKNYELLDSPLRPKSAAGKELLPRNALLPSEGPATAAAEEPPLSLVLQKIQKRPSTRQGHEGTPAEFDPATLDLTSVILPLRLDPLARAKVERKERVAKEAARKSEEAQSAAAALAAEIERELAVASAAASAHSGVARSRKEDRSTEGTQAKIHVTSKEEDDIHEDVGSPNKTIADGTKRKRRKAFKKIAQDSDDDDAPNATAFDSGKISSHETDAASANVFEQEQQATTPEEEEDEETKDTQPVLKVYRRARPSLAGIRQMVAPTDAAAALRFSSAMFHRSPHARRHKWDTSLPLPPDSETCCRRGLDLLGQNKVQDSIFWFAVGYGQEADTYADGTMGAGHRKTKKMSRYEQHKAKKRREEEEAAKQAAEARGEEWTVPQDPYFAREEVPKDVSVCAPQTSFDYGLLCILSRGIAYSRLGGWSQALWDFEEARSMADEKCREATLLCAKAREARGETRKALRRVKEVLDTDEFAKNKSDGLENAHGEALDPMTMDLTTEQELTLLSVAEGGSGAWNQKIRDKNKSKKQKSAAQHKSPLNRTPPMTRYDDVLYSQALSLQAKCLSGLKEHLKALRCYDEAVERDAANTEALWSRTRLFLDPMVSVGEDEKSRKRAALADLTNLVALDPGCPDYLEDAIDMFVDLAEYEEGLAVVDVLIEVWMSGGVHRGANVQGSAPAVGSAAKHASEDGPLSSSSLSVMSMVTSSSASASMPIPTKTTTPFKYQIFLTIFPGRKPSPVNKRQLALAQCLRARLRALAGFDLRHAVLPELEIAIYLNPSLPHPYLYRAALRHPTSLVESAVANNAYSKQTKLLEKLILSRYCKPKSGRGRGREESGDIRDMSGYLVIQDLSAAIDMFPQCVDALVLRASMYVRVGMFTPALRDLRDAAYYRQDLPEVWMLIAKIYLQHFHDYDSAANAASYAIALDATKKGPVYIRAEAHMLGGETDLALHEYSKLIRLDPTDPWPWLFQGQIFAEKGRARLALYSSIAYLRLLNPVKHCENQGDEKIKGTAFAALLVKAKAQSSSAGSNSASGGSGSSSTGASSFLSIAYLEAQKAQLPNALASLKRLDQAADEYRRAAALNPSVENTCRLSDALVNLGDVSEALKTLLLAIEKYDEVAQVHAALGRVYLSMEDYDRAIDEFNTAIEIDPRDASLYNAIGVCKTMAEQTHLSHIRALELQR